MDDGLKREVSGPDRQRTLGRREGTRGIAHQPEMLRHLGRHPSHLQRIAQGLCQGLRRTEMHGHLAEFGEGHQGSTQGEAHVELLRVPHPALRPMGQGEQRLLEGEHRLPIGGAQEGFVAGLPAIGDGLVPALPAQGVLGQSFHVLRTRSPASPSRASTMRACSPRRRSSSRLP